MNKINLSKSLRSQWPLGTLLLVLLFPSLATAHTGGGPMHGLVDGLAHPFTGLDHLAAMLAVGMWAAQRGGRSVWLVPLSFVVVMVFGGMLGMSAVALPLVEPAIAVSLLALGLLVAVAAPLPVVASVLLIGVFALFHGHAHGAELPADALGLTYIAGFALATASLHLAGIAIGVMANLIGSDRLIRYAGGAIAACGLYLCFA